VLTGMSFVFIQMMLLVGCSGDAATVNRLPGEINAIDWQPDRQRPLTLSGEWEVVWGELIAPENFDGKFNGDHFEIPGRWNRVTANGIERSFGAATFRLQLELSPYQGELALHLISPHSAWRLYVDNELVGQNGNPSTNPEEQVKHYVSRMMAMTPRSATLVLQVANHHHAYGGPGHAPVLWQSDQLRAFLDGMSLYYALVCGVLVTLGILHFTIYRSHGPVGHNRQAHFWFSLLCLILVYRVVGVIPYIHLYFGDHWVYGDLRAVYASLFVAPIIYLMFFRHVLPDQHQSRWWLILSPFLVVPLVVTLLTDEHTYTGMRNYAIGANVIVVCLITWLSLRASALGEPGARIIFVSNLLFLATSVNDALVYTDNGNGFDLTPLGILVLGIGYSFALRQRLQRTLLEANQAKLNLEQLNEQLEDQVTERTRAYQAATKRAENNATEQARFIAAASHDLRQPLHALAMFTTALRRQTKNSNVAGLVEKQEASIASLSDLLHDTLDAARLEAGTTKPQLREVSLLDWLNALATDYQAKADHRNIVFSYSTCAGDIVTDPSLLRRAVGNLLDNAIKSAAHRVQLTVKKSNIGWQFIVTDDGPGIATEDYDRVFKPYVSLQPSADGGYGLGLHVVSQICRALDGQVSLSRDEADGMQVTILLPETNEGVGRSFPIVRAPRAEFALDSLDLQGLRVLAIDDEPLIGEALEALLAGWNCNVCVVRGLSSAKAHLKSQPHPDVLIVDYHLQGLTGLQAIEQLTGELTRDTPALIITGATETTIHERIQASGYPLLEKPIRAKDLGHALARLHPMNSASYQATPNGKQR